MDTSAQNEAIVSAPGTINLGDTTYLIAKPTESDTFAVFQYARKQAAKHYNPIREAMEAIKDLDCTEAQRTAILLQAHRVQASREVPSEVISDFLMSARGAAFFFWILARKNHAELTLEKAEKLITEDNATSVFAELDEASGVRMIHRGFEAAGSFFVHPS